MFVQNVDLAYAPCSFVDQAPCLTADFVTWLKKKHARCWSTDWKGCWISWTALTAHTGTTKFNTQRETTGHLPFLDVGTFRSNGSLGQTPYRKWTSTIYLVHFYIKQRPTPISFLNDYWQNHLANKNVLPSTLAHRVRHLEICVPPTQTGLTFRNLASHI